MEKDLLRNHLQFQSKTVNDFDVVVLTDERNDMGFRDPACPEHEYLLTLVVKKVRINYAVITSRKKSDRTGCQAVIYLRVSMTKMTKCKQM